eukprot:15458685-Alexandrium_andersonii.AAC.1
MEFGWARARRDALELRRDVVGIVTSELLFVVRNGCVHIFDSRPLEEGECDSTHRTDEPRVVPLEALYGSLSEEG